MLLLLLLLQLLLLPLLLLLSARNAYSHPHFAHSKTARICTLQSSFAMHAMPNDCTDCTDGTDCAIFICDAL
jgi:hypothetical protein